MATSSRGLVFGALALSVIAVGLAAASFVRGASPGVNDGAPSFDEARIARLEENVARWAERADRAPEGSRARVSPPTGGATGVDASLDERLASLEDVVAELESDMEETATQVEALAEARSNPLKAIQTATPTPEQVAELRKLALDTKAESRPRLLAVRQLARVEGGRTLEIARAMRKLYEASDDERTQTGAIAMLQGVVEPEFEAWLVDTLLNAKYSSTRESATDVLSHYTGSPSVREALQDAVENDANHDVRADAQNALDKLDEREQDE